MQDKNKRRLTYDLKIREALEIRHHNSGPGNGLNEDMGAFVKTDIWDPILNNIGNAQGGMRDRGGGGGGQPSLGLT